MTFAEIVLLLSVARRIFKIVLFRICQITHIHRIFMSVLSVDICK